MIWFILSYVITLILLGIYVYIDMNKGESLEHYFRNVDFLLFIIVFLLPIFNTVTFILLIFDIIFKKIWDKIKYWEK
jgi:hypothetical protein